MSDHNFLVYADGLAIESKQLLLERARPLDAAQLEKLVAPIAGDPANLGCPVSKSGNLNTTEIYTDPSVQTHRYYLPTYHIAQIDAISPPLKRYRVSLEFMDDPAGKAIARLKVNISSAPPPETGLYPLPHDVTVSLQYLIPEKTINAGGVSTWKTIQFDEVKQKEETEIEAILHLYSLAELDCVYRVLSDDIHSCQLIVHCEADLSYRTLNQIYIPRPIPQISKLKKKWELFSDVKHEILPTAQPNITEVVREGIKSFDYRANLELIRTNTIEQPPFIIEEPPVIEEPPFIIEEPLISPSEIIFRAVLPSPIDLAGPELITHTDFEVLKARLGENDLHLTNKPEFTLPAHFFTDQEVNPAYVKIRASCDQKIPFTFSRDLHSYIYPNYAPQGEVALVRYQVGPDQAIFQDTTQHTLFYYLPDEFRLTREEVLPFRPALQVAFYSLSTQTGNGSATDGQTEYKVEFTFRAVPYLNPDREGAALDYIHQHKDELDLGGGSPSLAPLIPESAHFFLRLPKEGGGIEVVERPEADIAFPQHIVDALTLSANVFAEVFNSMRVGGETLNGTVKVKLPGRAEEYAIDFSGRLDKMGGPITEQFLLGRSETNSTAYKVKISNAIESAITLNEAVVSLLVNLAPYQWTTATVEAGILPLYLKPGEAREFIVWPTEPVNQAHAVRLTPLNVTVDLDLEPLWQSILETPGWGDITHPVTVTIDAYHFNGPNALSQVRVIFNHAEAIVELKKEILSATVELTKPILPYLLRQEEANDYFYQVESYHPDAEGKSQLVGVSSFQRDDAPNLTIIPPLG